MGNFAENLNLGNRFRPPLFVITGANESEHSQSAVSIVHAIDVAGVDPRMVLIGTDPPLTDKSCKFSLF